MPRLPRSSGSSGPRPAWTAEEEQHLKAVHAEFGKGKWDAKAARLGTGRSGGSVSQHWKIMEKKAAATADHHRRQPPSATSPCLAAEMEEGREVRAALAQRAMVWRCARRASVIPTRLLTHIAGGTTARAATATGTTPRPLPTRTDSPCKACAGAHRAHTCAPARPRDNPHGKLWDKNKGVWFDGTWTWPVQSKIRVLLCAARTLNATVPSRVTLSLR